MKLMDTAGIRLTPKEIVSKLNEYIRNYLSCSDYYSVSTTILSLVKTQISAATFKLSYAIQEATTH
jgi:aspartyl/asparaginyl-tRNA synthetase